MAERAKKLPFVSLNCFLLLTPCALNELGNNLAAALAANTMLEGDLESKNCTFTHIGYVHHGGMQTVTQSQFHLVFDT